MLRKGYKFLAFSLKLEQTFLNTLFLLSRTRKQVNQTLKKLSLLQILTILAKKLLLKR